MKQRSVSDIPGTVYSMQTPSRVTADANLIIPEDQRANPRYKDNDPDLTEQVDAYITYMKEDANAMEWSRAGFLALMIISLELGVFALASARRANAGEIRGYLAEIARSEEAATMFKHSLEALKARNDLKPQESIDIQKAVKIQEADATIFERALEEMRNDPAFLEKAISDVSDRLESMRLVTEKPAKSALDNTPKGFLGAWQWPLGKRVPPSPVAV